jgi:hypothetical protein
MPTRVLFTFALLLFLSTSALPQAPNNPQLHQPTQLCSLATPGPGFSVNDGKYVITRNAFDISTDVESAVRKTFGNDATIADWQTLKRRFSTQTQLSNFIDQVGIPRQAVNGPRNNFLVSNSGSYRTANGYWLFVARHDGIVPGNWAVLDSVGNHTLDLGRWTHKSQALVFIPNTAVQPLPSSAPPPSATPRNTQEAQQRAELEKHLSLPTTEFSRLLELPDSCSTIRAAMSSSVPKTVIEAQRGITCSMRKECLDLLSQKTVELNTYLRSRPLLAAEIRKQVAPSRQFDDLLSRLNNIISLYRRSISPNVSESFACSSINTTISYMFGRIEGRPLDAVVRLAQDTLTTLNSEYLGDIARYSDFIPFAKHYDHKTEIAHLKEQYEAAHASDPEQFLRLRPEFLQELSSAEQFKTRLATQTDELVDLQAQINNLFRARRRTLFLE